MNVSCSSKSSFAVFAFKNSGLYVTLLGYVSSMSGGTVHLSMMRISPSSEITCLIILSSHTPSTVGVGTHTIAPFASL